MDSLVWILYILYSLDITPPSFISPSPLTICINLLRRYIYLQFTPPSAIHGKVNKNERTLRLGRTRGRLELIVTPSCIELDLATYWPVIQVIGYVVAGSWWCENCIMFSDCTHSVP